MIKINETISFYGNVIRSTYNTPDFSVYALDVDKIKFPNVKHNKYNNVTIFGELPSLTEGIKYDVIAIEQTTKYGIGYKVVNIKRDVPTSKEDMYLFLREILTANQAKVLYEVYPDIVERVRENRLDDIDLNKLKGIKEYTFNVIKEKIIDNFCLADLVIEFQGYLTLSIIKKIYNKYSSIDVLKEKLRTNPYQCLCSLAGVGFKTADGILLEIEKVSNENIKNGKKPIIKFKNDLKTSPERCLSCLHYLLNKNEEDGHTAMNLADLRSACINLVPACADNFVDVIKSSSIYYDKETMNVALRKTFIIENVIANKIVNSVSGKNIIWSYDVEKYRNVNGSTLSDEQMQAVFNVCVYNISILNGAAGTGKSFSTQAIINMLHDNNKTFRLFSPTGKAAKVLAEYTEENAMTIHRGLCYRPIDRWGYYNENKIDCDIIIIDEFSMVDINLFFRVLEAIDLSVTKLLLIGDNAQLPSVSCGNLLHDFMESGLIPTTTLTKVFRYGEGGLMKIATDVRYSKQYLANDMKSKMTTFGDNKDYVFVDFASEQIPKNAVALYKTLLNKGCSVDDIQVLTAKNVGDCGTSILNNMIQMVANNNYGSEMNIKYGDTTYYVDDLIIQKVNNYKAELDLRFISDIEKDMYSETEDKPTAFIANGETGRIKEIQDAYMVIDFDGITVRYYKDDLGMIGLGYAITIHKSQGSSIKNVILCTPQSHIFMLNSNLLYVGLTRMKEKCYHLGTLNSINQAVKKKANLERHTLMQFLLANDIELNDTDKYIYHNMQKGGNNNG